MSIIIITYLFIFCITGCPSSSLTGLRGSSSWELFIDASYTGWGIGIAIMVEFLFIVPKRVHII